MPCHNNFAENNVGFGAGITVTASLGFLGVFAAQITQWWPAKRLNHPSRFAARMSGGLNLIRADWRRSLPLRGLIAGSRSRRRLRKRAFIRSASASRAACCASLPASPDAVLLSSWSAAAADALGVSLVDRSPAA